MALRVALAQLAPRVGDIEGNVKLLLHAWKESATAGADLVVATELAVTGYPPEDLLLSPDFVAAAQEAVYRLAAEGPAGITLIVGGIAETPDHPDLVEWDVAPATRALRNRAFVLRDGAIRATYDKWRLPNFGVFDEARYFVPGEVPLVVEVAGVPVGVTVCEDMWTDEGAVAAARAAGAAVIANLNASPYHRGKRAERERWIRHHALASEVAVVWVNQVGGQDELVFDGDSMVLDAAGEAVARAAQFAPDLVVLDLEVGGGDRGSDGADPEPGVAPVVVPLLRPEPVARLSEVAEVYEALVLGTRDYLGNNGFRTAVLGLSGGIDSALTCAIAVDALGADQVIGVAMPSPWSSAHSLADARELADNLGCHYHEVPIEPAMKAMDHLLVELFQGTESGVAEENIQSRLRGLTLMALSNKFGHLVLTTGNKSEYAVGYATLYGDMAGGYAVIKDVPKLLVYELSRLRAARGPSIPAGTIDKPPSAELRPGQLDTDSLPPYEVLDPIIEARIEDDLSLDDIVALGHDHQVVARVLRLIDLAEYKRRQSAPGPKITRRAFGRERRVPITTAWRG